MNHNKNNFSLFRYIYRFKWRYLFGIITLFIVDIFNLFVPQLTGEITDGLQTGKLDMSGVLYLVIQILLVGIVITVGRFFWRYFIFGSARTIEYQIRNDMFRHLEGLSTHYFNLNKTGDLMARFTNDLQALRLAIGASIITTFDATIMTIMVLVMMITHIDVQLTLLALIPLSLIAVGSIFYGKIAKKRFLAKQQAFSGLTDQVQESISGIRVIKAYVQERKELIAFAKENKNNMDKSLRAIKLQAVMGPLIDTIIGISIIITLSYGGYLAITGQITLGKFIAFNQYIAMLVWPMMATGESVTIFSQGKASLERVREIFNQKPEVYDLDTVKNVEFIRGNITINNLSFEYPDSNSQALHNISLNIKEGSTIAILGRTGCGKTTLINLLLRLYNPPRNTILIDGIDILDVPLKTLRENIAYVPQDSFLFSDTIQNNIAFGSNTTDITLVEKAAKIACIHDNIIDFPDGYQTIVGERGSTLSGGQKQRSSIARAIMKDSPILILDDALSAVDTNTEEQILHNLGEDRQSKTTIVIAHRISTIQNADFILVLDSGKIVESGTPKELMELDGIYSSMYKMQQLEKQLETE